MRWQIAAVYKFRPLKNIEELQSQLKTLADELEICGSILVAPEGVNGTFAGLGDSLSKFLDEFNQIFDLTDEDIKYSHCDYKPFLRMKVKLKREIITMRTDEADPLEKTGHYVDARDWNALISDPDVLLLDTRNDYEVRVGKFKNAIDPDLPSFEVFKEYVDDKLDPEKHPRVAMYCTGGIRCEKASSYMLSKGFKDVYQLHGGILKYLEVVPKEESLWEGDCFVFDKRVAVDHDLNESQGWHMCYGCRMPINDEDLERPEYEESVSCHFCAENLTPKRVQALRHRRELMKQRGVA